MKIFFLMLFYIDDQTRNNTKLSQQMEAVSKMGHDVYYIGIGNDGIYLCHNSEREFINSIKDSKINIFNRIQMCKAACKVIKHSNFDIAYIRNMTAVPSFVNVLRQLKKCDTKIVVEIPTYPDFEEANHERRFTRKIAKKILMPLEKKASSYVDLYTLIGEKANSYHGIRAINICNGIDVNKVSIWKRINDNSNDVHLIALANFCYWHGYERLIEGLANYYKNGGSRNVYLHFVGPDKDGSLAQWVSLSKSKNVFDNVVLEGSLYGEQLDEVFNKCDFAISALGEYKKGLSVDSALKSLTYLAKGIPFMHTGVTFESVEIEPFTLKVINDPSPIDINEILSKIDFLNNCNYESNILRNYCNNNCTWKEQFIRVFSELNNGIN